MPFDSIPQPPLLPGPHTPADIDIDSSASVLPLFASTLQAGAKMVRFVADVPDGHWVLVAVKGTVHSTSDDVAAAVTAALQ